jgi:UDP-glucose 4-epimerase
MIRESLANKTILVTGGAGFIGSHLVDQLIEQDVAHVIVIDSMFTGSEENLAHAMSSKNVTLYRDDAELKSSLDYIFDKHCIDVVFNLATKALNYSFINPANAFDTNVKIVLNLLELQRRGLFTTLCHFSTSEVYGSAVYEPMDELHPRNPTTTYAAGKAAADMAVESYVRMFGVDAFIVRPFNNYGPRQNYKGTLAGVIPITAVKLLTGGVPEIHGCGTQSRDFIYVTDTIDAALKLYGLQASGETVNISTDNQITVKELINCICAHFGYGGEIIRKDGRKSDVLCHNASNKKIKSLIDYKLTPFSAGLKMTLDWYSDKLQREPSI